MVYLAGASHIFGPTQNSKLYLYFWGFFFGVVARFVAIMTRTFCIIYAGVSYGTSEDMVSVLQGTKKNALQSVLFKNNTFVHSLEPCCNTKTCLDELHPISVICMPWKLSTVDYNDGVQPSIVLVDGPYGLLHFL